MSAKVAMVAPVQVWKWNVQNDYGDGVSNIF